MKTYVFDGSLLGLFTLLFDWYTHKPGPINIASEAHFQPQIFSDHYDVITDEAKANRVIKAVRKKISPSAWHGLYCTFLSEQPEAFTHIFAYVTYVFEQSMSIEKNYGNEHVHYLSLMNRKVNREKHHFEAFIRFELIDNSTYYAPVEPKYNVLPLLLKHFKNRYADQSWIIYDLIRKYGLYYDQATETVQPIQLEFAPKNTNSLIKTLNVKDQAYQDLWKNYFNSTTIAARKNTKLHVQMLPKRFWKYLPEK